MIWICLVLKSKDLRKACLPARGYCNRRLQCYRPTQFSGAKVGSENCKFGNCALSWAPPRFGLLLYCRRFVHHGVRNCKSTSVQLWKRFTVSTLRLACLAMHQITMKTQDRQLQRACKKSFFSSEATMRARSEILAVWAALKQLSENKNDAMCLVLLRLMKTKNLNMLLSFCKKTKNSSCSFPFANIGTSPDRTEQSFSGGMFLTLYRWKLP